MNECDAPGVQLPSGVSYVVNAPVPAPGQASPDELSIGWTDESDGDN